jgi:hypothetical protein
MDISRAELALGQFRRSDLHLARGLLDVKPSRTCNDYARQMTQSKGLAARGLVRATLLP